MRLRHGLAETQRLRFRGAPAARRQPTPAPRFEPDAFLIPAVLRGGRWSPMHAGFEPKPGDEALALLHREERAIAVDALAALGWQLAESPEA